MMNNLSIIENLVTKDDYQSLETIVAELQETFQKKQIFRTDTEARISVLNDGNFPTNASKYWQSVREQNVMLENLLLMSFDYRRNELAVKRYEKKLSEVTDSFDAEEIQIDLDECMFKRLNMELVAKDRVRELMMWSQIKNELNDGTFDTENVNTHQAISYKAELENRANSLGPAASPAEIVNVIGPLTTINRLLDQEKIGSLKSFAVKETKQLKEK